MKGLLFISFFALNLMTLRGQTIRELSDTYSKGQLEKSLELSNVLKSSEADNAEFNHLYGRTLADLSNFQDAVPILLKAIKLDNNKTYISGWSHGYLGFCYFMLGQYDNSKSSLDNCIKLNSTTNSTKFASKRNFLYGFDSYFSTWKIIETKNIRFHIQYPDKIVNIDSFINIREAALLKIVGILGSTLPKKIDFFVWDNKEEPMEKFKINLGFADPSSACVYAHKYQTISHEMAHVISFYIGKDVNKSALINEGIAVYFNMANDNKMTQLKTVILKGNYTNLKVMDFWNNFRNYSDDISYPFAGAFIQTLIDKYGIEKLKPLFINQTYDNAKKLFGEEFDSVISEFEKQIAEK